jgi:hypothetical protein
MRQWIFSGWVALGVMMGLSPVVGAQDVTSVTQPTGSGGTGATQIDTQYENQGITGLIDVYLNFTSVAPLSFSFDVDGAGAYTLHSDTGFNSGFTTGIVNNTGQVWTGFDFSVSSSIGAGANGLEVFNFFTGTFGPSNNIILGNGTMPSGDTLSVIFALATPSAGTVDVTYTPLVSSIPEPSSLVLLSLGSVGIVAASLHRRRSRNYAKAQLP